MSANQGKVAEILEKEAYNEVFDEHGRYIGYPLYQTNINWHRLGNPPSWCEATANYIQVTSLCSACSQYNFKELLKEPSNDEHSPTFTLRLGTIGEIVAKTDCSFCQFLL